MSEEGMYMAVQSVAVDVILQELIFWSTALCSKMAATNHPHEQ